MAKTYSEADAGPMQFYNPNLGRSPMMKPGVKQVKPVKPVIQMKGKKKLPKKINRNTLKKAATKTLGR